MVSPSLDVKKIEMRHCGVGREGATSAVVSSSVQSCTVVYRWVCRARTEDQRVQLSTAIRALYSSIDVRKNPSKASRSRCAPLVAL